MDGIIVSEDPEWMDASDISVVPDEHVDHWLSHCLHSAAPFSEIRHNAKELLVNLRSIWDRKIWDKGLIEECSSWEDVLLKRFRITPEQFAWLELGEPVIADTDTVEQAIEKGKEIAASQKIREATQQVLNFNPTATGKELTRLVAEELEVDGKTNEAIGDKLGSFSHQHVSSILRENASDPTNFVGSLAKAKHLAETEPPDWITHPTDRADFRKLSAESRSAVASYAISLNAACVKEGIRPAPIKLPPLEKAKKQFIQLSEEDRTAFDEWRSSL